MSFTKEEFMTEVQKYPIIYDKFSKEFKNNDMKKNAWILISEKFDISTEEAEKKYFNIRSAYGRAAKKRKLMPSGSGRQPVNQYEYLQWLDTYIDHRETSSNISRTVQLLSFSSIIDEVLDESSPSPTRSQIEENEIDVEIQHSLNETPPPSQSPLQSTAHHIPQITPQPTPINQGKGNKRKKNSNIVDENSTTQALLRTIEGIDSFLSKSTEDDEVATFTRSLEAPLRRLGAPVFAVVKYQIQQTIFRAEYPDIQI